MQLRDLNVIPYIQIGLYLVKNDESKEKIGHLETYVISKENAC